MNYALRRLSAVTAIAAFLLPAVAPAADAGRIRAYITPYYNSSGPAVRVGPYSNGLASNDRAQFVSTIQQMKRNWRRLTFPQLYVGAMRLYDLGYRDEATYWFYTAQYRGRQFGLLADQSKLGSMGDRGFELYQAQNAFYQLAGPQINGYAFGHIDALITIVRRVQRENRATQNLRAMYPGVTFVRAGDWGARNRTLNDGLGKLAAYVNDQRTTIAQQRLANGTQARFARLSSERFPGGY